MKFLLLPRVKNKKRLLWFKYRKRRKLLLLKRKKRWKNRWLYKKKTFRKPSVFNAERKGSHVKYHPRLRIFFKYRRRNSLFRYYRSCGIMKKLFGRHVKTHFLKPKPVKTETENKLKWTFFTKKPYPYLFVSMGFVGKIGLAYHQKPPFLANYGQVMTWENPRQWISELSDYWFQAKSLVPISLMKKRNLLEFKKRKSKRKTKRVRKKINGLHRTSFT